MVSKVTVDWFHGVDAKEAKAAREEEREMAYKKELYEAKAWVQARVRAGQADGNPPTQNHLLTLAKAEGRKYGFPAKVAQAVAEMLKQHCLLTVPVSRGGKGLILPAEA